MIVVRPSHRTGLYLSLNHQYSFCSHVSDQFVDIESTLGLHPL